MPNVSDFISKQLNKKKVVIGVSSIVIIALVGFYYLGGAKKAEGNYIAETVQRGTISSTISANGIVEPVNTVSLSFKNSEVINKIHVKLGDHVTTGQLLAEQDTANLQAQVTQASASLKSAVANLAIQKNSARPEEIAQAEADVSAAQASYELAKSNWERNQQLLQQEYISQAEFDQISYEYVNAEAKLKQAEESLKLLKAGNRPEEIAAATAQVESNSAQLQMAEKELAESKIYSPIDGIISAINGAEGQRATANNNNTSGGGFIDIISEALQVKAQVNESDIGKLKVGQQAEFTVNSFPEKTFTGRVSSISPQAYTESNVQLYDAIIQIDKNQTGLMAGMPANVNIIFERQENALTIPKGAVTYAANFQNKMRQSGDPNAKSIEGSANSGRTNSTRSGGDTHPNIDDTGGDTVKGDTLKQRDVVIVLNEAEKPVLRQVVLGLSDLSRYEVVEGLSMGEKVVVGALGQNTGGVSSQGSNPLMPGGGGMVRVGGAGR
ncbi:HlyD family secretion protein [Desulfoscipio gibsoniae]|uniref:Multidrug resistance efflux pump n=1 Tax=Desulfoscipio gibsoniae DSM 7213 TaxID=767817 RepID=R4KE48_9FIRM|nr:efflux RND transporter periplasmic adaptor subunit [Desulfoscipio gibsoniae]AGL00864.1 multidrug resistance efflux pump [Desulfoscipio gibsoniae DSM 7213]